MAENKQEPRQLTKTWAEGETDRQQESERTESEGDTGSQTESWTQTGGSLLMDGKQVCDPSEVEGRNGGTKGTIQQFRGASGKV